MLANYRRQPTTFLVLTALIFFLGGCQTTWLVSKLLSDDPGKRGEALTKLTELPDDKIQKVLPPLVNTLRDIDPRKVERAVDALTVIGKPAVPSLLASLKDQDPYVRMSAAQSLGLIGISDPASVKELADLLSDPHPLVRDEAALALGNLGEAGNPAVPQLAARLNDEDKHVIESAQKALTAIGTPAAKAALNAPPASKGVS